MRGLEVLQQHLGLRLRPDHACLSFKASSYILSGLMEVATPTSVLKTLAELRRELQGELEGLAEKRSRLERELGVVDKDIEAKRRMLELVEATEEQLEAQRREQPEDGLGASTQVRGSAMKLQYIKRACVV
jgi:chromosome segregation ATPase